MNKKTKASFLLTSMFFGFLAIAGCSTGGKTEPAQSGESQVKTISTQDVKASIGKDGWVVVDTRLNDAFNGWQVDGVARGGHIQGAVDFSANWLNVSVKDKDQKLQKVLETKGITKDKNVILYSANGKDAQNVAQYLTKQGFTKLNVYDVKEWAANAELPMESFPNYQKIVPATWVDQTIKQNNNGKPYKIFEVSWGKESEDYVKGHIPGAVHLNTDEVEAEPVWNRLPDKQLEQFALNNGITVDTTTILYGADSMAAYRVAAILQYMGVKDVRVLNGGFAAWQNAGYTVETKANNKTPVASFGATVPVNKNVIIDMPEAKQILADKNNSLLVDTRSWDEYIGKISGYNYIKPKGRPAGAVWGHSGSDSSNLDDYRNIDGTMRNPAEILAMWKEWGITPDKNLSFYCGTGWRAAEVLIYAEVMGLKNVSLYDGGWNEWSMNPANPVEQGDPRQK